MRITVYFLFTIIALGALSYRFNAKKNPVSKVSASAPIETYLYDDPKQVAPDVVEPIPIIPTKLTQPFRDADYYENGFKTLTAYISRERLIERLNKNEVTESERERFMNILERAATFQTMAIKLRIAKLEKEHSL